MKLLDEYKDKKVHLKTETEMVIFDTSKVDESEYHLFHSLGFDFCFEPTDITYKKPISYTGIEQEIESTKLYKNKDAKKDKAKTKKA